MRGNSNLNSGYGVWGIGYGQDTHCALGEIMSKNCPLGRAALEKGWVGKNSRPVKLCLPPRPSGEFLNCRFSNLHSGYGVWGIGYGQDAQAGKCGSKKPDLEVSPQTPNPIPHTPENKCGCSKSGFGIIEVLIAAVVLGFLVIGLTQLQLGNREAVLRIRTRDAAQIVAQQFLDSLSSIGINSIEDSYSQTKDYEWLGKANQKTVITYEIKATVDNENTMESEERSNFTDATGANAVHTRAKKIDLTVSWPFKGGEQKINLSRIVK